MTSSYQGMGISIKAYAEGNTLVYDYTLSDTYSSMGDMMTSSLDGMDSTFKSVAQTLNETCDTAATQGARVPAYRKRQDAVRQELHGVSGSSSRESDKAGRS